MTEFLKPFLTLRSNIKLRETKDIIIDNLIFRLHYRYTAILLFVCTVLVTSRQYIGEHIKCIVGNGLNAKVVSSYCFFMSTFTVFKHLDPQLVKNGTLPHLGVGPYTVGSTEEVVYHAYYQWVPFMLFGQAIMFILTHIMWKKWEGGKLKALLVGVENASFAFAEKELKAGKVTIPSIEKKRQGVALIRNQFLKNNYITNFWPIYLITCETLNVLHIILQMCITDKFLGGIFWSLGFDLMDRSQSSKDLLDTNFPKVDGKSSHIPYRNSKLTRLLQDSLGGNSKTAMIAMISPCDADFEESTCTLRYAARVKQIQNHAHINVEHKGLIEGFEQEIADLQQKIMELSTQEVQPTRKRREKSAVDARTDESAKWKAELEKTEKEKLELEQKISTIQKKILVGGINLLEKAQEQEFELKNTGEVLESLDKSHLELQEKLEKAGAEKIDFKEKYATLQEEEAALTKKIKKIQALLNEFKEEYKDKEHEYQREMEALLDNNRLLMRETQLAALIIDSYIPIEYTQKIEQNLIWNMESQEFQMRGVAYTGNNMRKHKVHPADFEGVYRNEIKPVYHKYAEKRREKRSLEKKCYSALQKYANVC